MYWASASFVAVDVGGAVVVVGNWAVVEGGRASGVMAEMECC